MCDKMGGYLQTVWGVPQLQAAMPESMLDVDRMGLWLDTGMNLKPNV